MRIIQENLIKYIHNTFLKSHGYKKKNHVLSCEKATYILRFHFQSSMQNNTLNSKWRFYINIGVEFKAYEPLKNWSHFPHTHWATRLQSVVSNCPESWIVESEGDIPTLASQISSLMFAAEMNLDGRIEEIEKIAKASLQLTGQL